MRTPSSRAPRACASCRRRRPARPKGVRFTVDLSEIDGAELKGATLLVTLVGARAVGDARPDRLAKPRSLSLAARSQVCLRERCGAPALGNPGRTA